MADTVELTEPITPKKRTLLLSQRQALIIELGAIEDYLGLERSIIPRRKRGPLSPEQIMDKFDRAVKDRLT